MARRVVSWATNRDTAALAGKDDKPHCLFEENRVVVRNNKQELLARIEHVSIYDDNSIAYDEAIRFERGGSIFFPVSPTGLVGMRRVWRPQTLDANYRTRFPIVDLAQLGQMTWDVCGGYGDPDTTPEQAARLEAEEEGRFPVVEIEYLGKTVMNRGSDVHFTHLFWGTFDHDKLTEIARDILEKNKGGIEYFTKAQRRQMFFSGELYDQCILSAEWAFEARYPGRLT